MKLDEFTTDEQQMLFSAISQVTVQTGPGMGKVAGTIESCYTKLKKSLEADASPEASSDQDILDI